MTSQVATFTVELDLTSQVRRNPESSDVKWLYRVRFPSTGLPLWQVEVIDADQEARTRTVKVKVVAQVQPMLPVAPSGVPFVAVEFTGLTVTPYVNQNGKLGYSVKATGVRAPGRPAGRPGQDGKESAA